MSRLISDEEHIRRRHGDHRPAAMSSSTRNRLRTSRELIRLNLGPVTSAAPSPLHIPLAEPARPDRRFDILLTSTNQRSRHTLNVREEGNKVLGAAASLKRVYCVVQESQSQSTNDIRRPCYFGRDLRLVRYCDTSVRERCGNCRLLSVLRRLSSFRSRMSLSKRSVICFTDTYPG